jgi:tetratricopeptide (TPR) repeat protein
MPMKKVLITYFFLLSVVVSSSQQDSAYFPLEFVYGNSEFDSLIQDSYIIPLTAQRHGIQISMMVSFDVDSLGRIDNIQFPTETRLGMIGLYASKEAIDSLIFQSQRELKRVIIFSEGLWIMAEKDGKFIRENYKRRVEITPEQYHWRMKDLVARKERLWHEVNYSFDILTLKIDNPPKYYNLGLKKLQQKKYYIASKYFKEAIKYDSKYIDAYYNLGISEFALQNNASACKSWGFCSSLGDDECQQLLNQYCK